MGSHSGNDDPHFVSNISCSVVHGNAESPVVGSLQFFISQARMGGV